MDWVRRRSFRYGQTSTMIAIDFFGFKGLVKRLAVISIRFLLNIILLPMIIFFPRKYIYLFQVNFYKILGTLNFFIGRRYREYEKTHGQ